MPRCCVPRCDTGTSAEIVRMRKAKARNKSTFLLPADYGLFRKWEKVLGLKYDTDDGRSGRVCELHFDEADIIRHYYKQMEDGSIKQFTFSRPTLKKGIIPLATPREEEFKPQGCEEKRKYKLKKVSKAQSHKDHVSKPHGRKRKSSLENDDEYIPNRRPKKSNTKEIEDAPKNYQKRKGSSETDDGYIPNKRTKKSNAKKIGNAPKNYEKRTYKRQIRTPRNKLISTSAKKSSLPVYNFDKLVHNLNKRNSKLPKRWEFSTLDHDTVKFVYTPESSEYFLTCTLKREIFLSIRAFNKNRMVNVEFKFLSHSHLLESLEELQKVRCCKGIINKIFAKRCKGFVPFNEKHQELKNSGRCKVCRKVWNNIIRRSRQLRCRVKLSKRLHSMTPKMKLSTKIKKFLKKKIKAGRSL